MGKKNKSNSLGRSLIKDRFGHSNRRVVDQESMIHTTELQDGYDWGRLNLQSVTEESSFNDFLRTAELAGTEFQAEKLNISFVNPKSNVGLLSSAQKQELEQRHIDKKNLLQIPRRPKWTTTMSAEQLHKAENEAFLDWRRGLAMLQEKDGLMLTPYEKNLEFWRQLWRVVERSDVVVQIVDARNPLLFRNEDLEKYVKEVGENKLNMVLINKADFLTDEQRAAWASFFDSQNLKVAFFSAIIEEDNSDANSESKDDDNDNTTDIIREDTKAPNNSIENARLEQNEPLTCAGPTSGDNKNNPDILSRQQLINLFKTMHSGPKCTPDKTTIGLVGYPNVGKSSTINALMTEKKVSVSATPGKTKHFQTLFLDSDLLLCDCPGLVMPSFVLTKADMVLNGILPIDQMRDFVGPVNLMCTEIPRHVLEDKYGIIIAKPLEGEIPDRPPYAEELLLAYGYNRGFMTANGQPDQSRSARCVLKDYVSGKLLYSHAPPGEKQEDFHQYPPRQRKEIEEKDLPKSQQRAMRINKNMQPKELDDQFFEKSSGTAFIKGRSNFPHIRQSAVGEGSISDSMQNIHIQSSKPWRNVKKEKREKLRRKYAHLDQH